MKLFGWLFLVGGSLVSVVSAFMLIMQIGIWLTDRRSSWPPMGLSIFWGAKLHTGWAGVDLLFNSQIPTVLMVIAALNALLLAILGMKTIDKYDKG